MIYRIKLLLFLALVCFFVTPSVAKKKGRAGEDLRLPRDILPRLYEVSLLPTFVEGNFTTEGSVSVLVDCVQSTSNITFHIADIAFNANDVSVG